LLSAAFCEVEYCRVGGRSRWIEVWIAAERIVADLEWLEYAVSELVEGASRLSFWVFGNAANTQGPKE
jgi:hypothetical protein